VISKRVRPPLRPFHPATRPCRLAVRPSSSTSGGRKRKQRAAQGFHHVGSGSRDAVAFNQKAGTILRGALADRCGQRADRGKRLSELIVKLARQVPAFLVLQADQPARQLVALGESRGKPFGKVVEHVADCGKLGKIERRQPR
jgi:hypothetical protein